MCSATMACVYTACAACVIVLVLVVNSDWFQMLWSYTLLLKLPSSYAHLVEVIASFFAAASGHYLIYHQSLPMLQFSNLFGLISRAFATSTI